MGIMNIDTDLVEQITYVSHYAASAIEDAEATLRSTYSEMCNEICTFYGLPQWNDAINDTRIALDKVTAIRGRVEALERLLLEVKGEYAELEKQHIHALERVSTQIASINTMIQGVMTKEYPVGMIEGETASDAKKLEQSLSNVVLGMEMANLTAVKKTAEEEYSFEKVVPMGNTTVLGYENFKKKNDGEDEE